MFVISAIESRVFLPIKVGKFYMVFLDERKGREAYSVSEDAFSTEEDALRTASKKTNLRSQLLSFCQV